MKKILRILIGISCQPYSCRESVFNALSLVSFFGNILPKYSNLKKEKPGYVARPNKSSTICSISINGHLVFFTFTNQRDNIIVLQHENHRHNLMVGYRNMH
ncbi:hypothetical protein CDL12_16504 [Handroanthus impetiginosus]|uniref:Uncharacterized protein n=1 Tax=Handroanthus impetiginosus TaxID=429701 RepID=A0A2G9H058_9LAMI|nr:hypothetical protein CDL12_16504 [Handroanthus impetiginosus]